MREWSSEERRITFEMWNEGNSASIIAKELGTRSRCAVVSYVTRNVLPKRETLVEYKSIKKSDWDEDWNERPIVMSKQKQTPKLREGSLGVIERTTGDKSRITLKHIPSIEPWEQDTEYSYISRDQIFGKRKRGRRSSV